MRVIKIKPEDTYKIRLDVLKTSDTYEYKYQGDFDESTIHLAGFIDDVMIGVVSLMKHDNPHFNKSQMQLRGMAVLENTQSKGVGKALVDFTTKWCIEKNIAILWCNARENVTNFYSKQGFEILGKRFFIKNVCFHYLMYKELDIRSNSSNFDTL